MKRDKDLSRELTGRPKLNPKSERICEKIHAQFVEHVRQGYVSPQMQDEIAAVALPVGQEGPLPHQNSKVKQNAKEESKKIQGSAGLLPRHMVTSPAAQQLLANKRALAKAVPQLPSFKPKINQKSARLVQRQV